MYSAWDMAFYQELIIDFDKRNYHNQKLEAKMIDEEFNYKYIKMIQAVPGNIRKTRAYFVYNIRSGERLGMIAWYGAWRQYCFWPITDRQTIFSPGCLADIQSFIKLLMDARKEPKVTHATQIQTPSS